ncbi:MAG: hypothetical protein QOH97_2285 [Actinoplanes sp.]|jgi:hypothetical protein|nr:hypothetical protein [Actinoplanes sp.]
MRVSGLRRPSAGDDTGSLMLAMLLTIVIVGASVVLGTTVVAQIQGTGTDVRRDVELNAAQSGIEVALAQIRATVREGDGTGALAQLPCDSSAAAKRPNAILTGSVGNGGATPNYSVNVYYLSSTPPDNGAQEDWAKNHRIDCQPGGGTVVAPDFAFLAATGRAVSASSFPGRTIVATYKFQSRTKPNVPGGSINVYNSALCVSAPAAVTGTPPLQVGASVIVTTCAADDPRQDFTYNPSLQIELKNSEGSTNFPDGACLDAASIDHTRVKFQNCVATKLTEIWSLNNRDNFEGTNGTVPNGKCFNIDYTKSPATVVINNVIPGNANKVAGTSGDGTDGTPCSGTFGDYTPYKSFFPDSNAGTGGAGPETGQLVNYEQFGRCLDVSANTVSFAFMVIFPCKQTPNGAIQWNQVWYLPPMALGATSALGRISVHSGGSDYCLVSPGSVSPQKWVTLTLCSLTDLPVPPNQMWTRRAFTGVPSTSYRIESEFQAPTTSYCLRPAVPPAVNAYWTGGGFDTLNVSKLVLGACDDSNLQKWNASPSLLTSIIDGYHEK